MGDHPGPVKLGEVCPTPTLNNSGIQHRPGTLSHTMRLHSETIRPCIEYGFKSSIPAWRLGVFQPPSRHTEMESPSDPMVADIRSHENPRHDASNRATTKSSMVSMGRVLPCSITLEELVGNPQRGGGTRNLHSVRPTTYAQPMPSLPNSDPETRRQTQRTRKVVKKRCTHFLNGEWNLLFQQAVHILHIDHTSHYYSTTNQIGRAHV